MREEETTLTKREELDLFILRADELIECQYILADVKIVNLLKAIAQSDTLLAVFKNCLDGFSFDEGKKKYLLDSKFQSENRGEFVLPTNNRELLALIFNLLVKIDSKEIDFSNFLTRYFSEDGSYSGSFSAFINAVIKPFKGAVLGIMESVLEGTLQDPVEAFIEAENRKEQLRKEQEEKEQKERELLQRESGENIKKIKELLLADKTKVREKKFSKEKEDEIILIIDTLANVVELNDKDSIHYAFLAYKYMTKSFPMLFLGKEKKISTLLEGVVRGL